MSRTARERGATADEYENGPPGAYEDAPTEAYVEGAAEADENAPAKEYERLRTKKKQRRGNAERATIRDVSVAQDRVVLTAEFDWTTETEQFVYDLNDDRDVLKLDALTDATGYDFEQVRFLEGETLNVVYTETEWVPEPHVAHLEGEGSAGETFVTELRLLVRELARSPAVPRRLVRTARSLTTRQLVVGVVLVKKLIVVALLVWLLL